MKICIQVGLMLMLLARLVTVAGADLLIATAQTVRSVQPEAQIIGMAMAGVKLDFTEQVLEIR